MDIVKVAVLPVPMDEKNDDQTKKKDSSTVISSQQKFTRLGLGNDIISPQNGLDGTLPSK
jgi:hypothetical protein